LHDAYRCAVHYEAIVSLGALIWVVSKASDKSLLFHLTGPIPLILVHTESPWVGATIGQIGSIK